jgi:medium-chain acyl-[acyl-carrier-protein] hydrolase
MAAMDLKIFRQAARLGYFDFDPKLRLSAVACWRALQDAAGAHAAALSVATETLRMNGQTWMLSKMAVEMARYPRIGEYVMVETWPSTKLKGARAHRDFVMTNAGGEILARAASLWVIVDLASRRPVRIPDSIVALRTDPGHAIPELTEAFADAGGGETKLFEAQWSDCDQNEHVNNAAVVRWAVDALPKTFLENHVLDRIEAHYLAEIRLGEAVEAHTRIEGPVCTQELRTGGVAARVESRWRAENH